MPRKIKSIKFKTGHKLMVSNLKHFDNYLKNHLEIILYSFATFVTNVGRVDKVLTFYFICFPDEIGNLLGEGTFGKVLDCHDR